MTAPRLSIQAENISCAAGGKTLLSDVSFSVARGGLLSIIGPNGAGKSTLLKCVGGLTARSAGRVLIDGRELGSMGSKERARSVAWLHQSADASLPFTARELALMSRYPWRPALGSLSRADAEAADAALERAGAAEFADRRLSTLSGGERQRAMLAAALAQGAETLFLDEPTSFLDYRHQAAMTKLIMDINREGMTVVMVTHDINMALQTGGEALAIKGGRAVWNGPAAGLLEPGTLSSIFDTEFEFFNGCGGLFAVPGRL